MISVSMLSKINARLQTALKNQLPFGGLHVIFFGDFVQYPPVSGTPLFAPLEYNSREDINATVTGRSLWLQLNYAKFLKKQMRQTDEAYGNILTALRNHDTTNQQEHYKTLAGRVMGSSPAIRAVHGDFHDSPIITTRNAVRTSINFAKTKQAAIQQSRKQIVVLAHDRPNEGFVPTPSQRIALLHELDNDCQNLIGMLPLVRGMPLVIKANIATELGICNGTRCTLSRIVFNENQEPFEPESDTGQEHLIRLMPAMLIVKIDNPRFAPFDSLEPGEFPIFPIQSRAFEFKQRIDGRKTTVCYVKRTQLPVLPGYALTGYTAQGGTFQRGILDITTPGKGCGKVDPADTYVLLSRMKTLDGLLILRPFDKDVLDPPRNINMRNEISRLEALELNGSGSLPVLPSNVSTPQKSVPAGPRGNAGKMRKCDNRHPLIKGAHKEVRSCDTCCSKERPGSWFWSCVQCDVDFCDQCCVKRPSGSESMTNPPQTSPPPDSPTKKRRTLPPSPSPIMQTCIRCNITAEPFGWSSSSNGTNYKCTGCANK